LGLAYNAFLFASVGDDGGGAPLSTASVLARLDIDPWEEAAQLTRLPKDHAVRRLAALLARLPGRPAGLAESETIAVRLVALLPRGGSGDGGGAAPSAQPGATLYPLFVAIGLGLAMMILMAAFLDAPPDRTPAPSGGKPSAVSSAPQIGQLGRFRVFNTGVLRL
jgi:hypothetical protein